MFPTLLMGVLAISTMMFGFMFQIESMENDKLKDDLIASRKPQVITEYKDCPIAPIDPQYVTKDTVVIEKEVLVQDTDTLNEMQSRLNWEYRKKNECLENLEIKVAEVEEKQEILDSIININNGLKNKVISLNKEIEEKNKTCINFN